MNLIDENFEEKKIKEDKNKKMAKIILILMGVILVVIIGLIIAMTYIRRERNKGLWRLLEQIWNKNNKKIRN